MAIIIYSCQTCQNTENCANIHCFVDFRFVIAIYNNDVNCPHHTSALFWYTLLLHEDRNNFPSRKTQLKLVLTPFIASRHSPVYLRATCGALGYKHYKKKTPGDTLCRLRGCIFSIVSTRKSFYNFRSIKILFKWITNLIKYFFSCIP